MDRFIAENVTALRGTTTIKAPAALAHPASEPRRDLHGLLPSMTATLTASRLPLRRGIPLISVDAARWIESVEEVGQDSKL